MSKKLKLLGLALMAVCAFAAIPAAGAQAAGPVFTVNGVTSGNEALSSAVPVTSTTVAFKVPGLWSITCKKTEFDEGTIKVGTNEGTIKSITFFECEVLGKNGEATTCKVQGGSPAVNGQIHTNPVKLELSTGPKSQHYVTFLEDGVANFAELKFTECTLEGKFKIHGITVFGALGAETFTASQELESSEAIQKASEKKFLYVERELFFIGKTDIKLASGRTWDITGW
jgi:hypothetical protein